MSILFVIVYLYAGLTLALLQHLISEIADILKDFNTSKPKPKLKAYFIVMTSFTCLFWPVILPSVLLAMYRVRKMK